MHAVRSESPVRDVPLCVSLCHHSRVAIVVAAESGTQGVTRLAKSTVPVSMQQQKAFCFCYTPALLKLNTQL